MLQVGFYHRYKQRDVYRRLRFGLLLKIWSRCYEGLKASAGRRRPWMSTKRRKRHNPKEIVRKLRDKDAMLNFGKRGER